MILNNLFTFSACNGGYQKWKLEVRQTEDSYGFEGFPQAHILYRRPDHNWLLQSYVWQAYDLFPEFPELQRFLAFWREKLEGPLHSVQVAHCKLIKPAELKPINGEFRLH